MDISLSDYWDYPSYLLTYKVWRDIDDVIVRSWHLADHSRTIGSFCPHVRCPIFTTPLIHEGSVRRNERWSLARSIIDIYFTLFACSLYPATVELRRIGSLLWSLTWDAWVLTGKYRTGIAGRRECSIQFGPATGQHTHNPAVARHRLQSELPRRSTRRHILGTMACHTLAVVVISC